MASKDLKVPIFHPTLKDCEGSWEAYIAKIEPKFREVGICKIVPPKAWKPSKVGCVEEREVVISRPIEQKVTGKQGVYQALLLERKAMSLQKEFIPLAADPENQPPKDAKPEDLEREFWRSMNRHAPIYGADVDASFFDKSMKTWNMRHLDSLLTRVLEDRLPGVNTPYLYFGMWRSFFGWHTEDMELHSINYLHYGAPKHWYCIPPAHRERFETWVKGLLPDCFRACSEFFRHKELLISPSRLRDASIPFVRMVQYPGEMVINFPGAYHSGFNSGFNCAESTNFATTAWIEFGAEADCCTCRKDTVNIDMRRFIPYADEETREVIEHNFVSDSEGDSGSEFEEDSDEESAAAAAECSEQSAPEQDGDEDSSSDYTKGHASAGRKASCRTAQRRNSKENQFPGNQRGRATASARKQAPKQAAKSVQSKQNSSTAIDSSRMPAVSTPAQPPCRVSRLSHLRNGSRRTIDGDPSVRRSKRLRHEEPESPNRWLRRKQDATQSKLHNASDSSKQASQSMSQGKQGLDVAPQSKLVAGSAAAAISMHCIAGSSQDCGKQSSTSQQVHSTSQQVHGSPAQPTCSDSPSLGIICKRLFGAKAG